MKERISVTLDKEIVRMLSSMVRDRKYRNRSHAVEMAIEQLKKTEDENGKNASSK